MPLSKEIIGTTLETAKGERGYKVVERLTDAGHEAWWVGGAVRDMLQERVPTDIDIATSALPEQMLVLFPRANGAAAALGSIRVSLGHDTFELTTFREDDEASDGRHPESVAFTPDRSKDALRRDFTVNALYWHPISRELFDPSGGEADLHEKLVRFVGDPAVRIKHDTLRMLRAVRVRATLNGQYHPETYRALQELAPTIEILSGSRMLGELEKILMRPNPDRAFEDLWELRLLDYILPELRKCKGIPQPKDYHREGDVWEHTMQCLRSFRDDDPLDVRLAALFHDSGKAETFSLKGRIRFDRHATVSAGIVETALGRLQCPGKRMEKIVWIVKHHMMMGTFFGMPEERKAHWYFHPWFGDLLRLFWLDVAGTTPADFSLYDRIAHDVEKFLDAHPKPAKPLLTGEEVMAILGIQPGAEVGEALQKLHEAQGKGKVTGKQEARTFLKRMKR
ncbi:MAG: Uncharacterized protein Greene041619_1098 [Candidatus Peregrinibacteria bacterium Greene0416_19]|nr:MAG: Uncharacterized protein Greene041619_1098 [Candidatus Peregrinibacteria bacterium Greene0416_19]